MQIAVNRMRSTRSRIVPIIVGALRIIKENVNDYLKMLLGQPSQFEVQKIALMRTAHIIRMIL